MNTASEKATGSITDFYHSYVDALFDSSVFKKQILNCGRLQRKSVDNEKFFFKSVLDSFLEEAELTLALLNESSITKKDVLLEVGGGLGLVYGFLKKQGYTIYGIEPNDSGFDGYFSAALALCSVVGVDGSNFRPLLAKDVGQLNTKFDRIFSNNVFEHIPELEESIACLGRVLKEDGVMIHNTVNYHVPYEPHFMIPLVPFFPRLTEYLKPTLKTSALWNGLFFVTTTQLKRMCSKHGLNVEFKKDRLRKTLMRLDTDPSFARRQKYFVPIYRLLKRLRLVALLDHIPIALTTPITFTITRV